MISPTNFSENSENMGIIGTSINALQRYKISYNKNEHQIIIEEPSDWSFVLIKILYFI